MIACSEVDLWYVVTNWHSVQPRLRPPLAHVFARTGKAETGAYTAGEYYAVR